jgi:hypothetical protein
MGMYTILFWVALVALIFFLRWNLSSPVDSSKVKIVLGSVSGELEKIVSVPLPISFNQPEGLTYSYSAWILVKDFGKGYGQRRRIFSKDDAPGVYIDSTSNSMIVSVDTFGTTETILIPSIPAMKWIHFALVVDQQSVDIYINGVLRQHHTLGQLPNQNEAPIKIGPGWDGVLADLTYYSKSLKHTEIKKMSKEPVPDDLQRDPAAPQYFDMSWYIGRLYSK